MTHGASHILKRTTVTRAVLLLAVGIVVLDVSQILAATIDVGSHIVAANSAGQEIEILVSGGESVAGFDLFLQVGDGGPELINVGLPAGTDAPEVSGVDLLSGTIFDGATATQTDPNRSGVVQVFFSNTAITLPAQTVSASGTLAKVTIDTTGFNSGTYDLFLSGVLPGLSGGPFNSTLLASGGAPVSTTVNNGTLTVVSASAADFNTDDVVSGLDFLVLQRGFGVGTTFAEGDANGDNVVDNADLEIWEYLYGNVISPLQAITAVPEPSTVLLSAGAVLCLPRRRFRDANSRNACLETSRMASVAGYPHGA